MINYCVSIFLAFLLGSFTLFLYFKLVINKKSDEKIIELTKTNEFLQNSLLDKEALKQKNQLLMIELTEVKTKLAALDNIQELIKNDFVQLANDVIKKEQADLRKQNQEALEIKMAPLSQDLKDFKEKVELFNVNNAKNTTDIKTQISLFMNECKNISNSASELTKAFKENSQDRGYFGEFILESVLKSAGLINKKDDPIKGNFVTQEGFKSLDNPNEPAKKPDVVVYFPDENKNIIIDSKFPLIHFQEFVQAQTEDEKNVLLAKFYKAIEEMVIDLSKKYNSLDGLNTPDFKFMFIPLESCMGFVYSNQKLIEIANKNNVLIVGPSTLFAALRMIHYTWTQKNQANNIKDILSLSQKIYDKTRITIDALEGLKTNFTTVQKGIDKVFTPLTGKGGLVSLVTKFHEFGVAPINKIDEKYLETTQV